MKKKTVATSGMTVISPSNFMPLGLKICPGGVCRALSGVVSMSCNAMNSTSTARIGSTIVAGLPFLPLQIPRHINKIIVVPCIAVIAFFSPFRVP